MPSLSAKNSWGVLHSHQENCSTSAQSSHARSVWLAPAHEAVAPMKKSRTLAFYSNRSIIRAGFNGDMGRDRFDQE